MPDFSHLGQGPLMSGLTLPDWEWIDERVAIMVVDNVCGEVEAKYLACEMLMKMKGEK